MKAGKTPPGAAKTAKKPPATVVEADEPDHYTMRISRLTIDKLGVKLYDKVSAVVAELVANGYDADAEHVHVEVPLGLQLAFKGDDGEPVDRDFEIVVRDDGHGMTPREAQDYFLVVGTDRRERVDKTGVKLSHSREKHRSVMGRKGIGKLAPFGICRRIEVLSSGGPETTKGYRTSHFCLDFDELLKDSEEPVPLESGPHDKTYRKQRGTEVRLTCFLPKRVPVKETFVRQLGRRFALSASDFEIVVRDTITSNDVVIPPFLIPLNEATKVDVGNRPVPYSGGTLPVSGWLAHAKESYRDEEEAGVRIYARGKIVAVTRDFEQPPGFTGEFTTRSYLVGEVHAEWLDEDDDDDLVRTDRQGILWDSDKGEALRQWGAGLIKEIGAKSKAPRRQKNAQQFVQLSSLEKRARQSYADESVVDAALLLGKQIGAFASEEDLGDEEYVKGLADVILSVAPHQALITAFRQISGQTEKTIEDMLELFGKTRVAEMASFAQIADEHLRSIEELQEFIDNPSVDEADLQNLIAGAPWLIQPDWSVITENQSLKNFRDRFAAFFETKYGVKLEIAISYERKRPDFTLVHVGRKLRVVELKKPGHNFADKDYERMDNYIEAIEEFFEKHKQISANFPDGWQIDLVADGVKIHSQTLRRAYRLSERAARVVRFSWEDFLDHAKASHAAFLDARDQARKDGA